MNNTMMIQETHNALVLEYVLDTNGFTSEEPCPCCGQAAVRREFDELLGGCINRVYSLGCTHCSHHECDQEFCSKCEANMEENKRGYSKACYYADEPQAVVHWWKKTMLDARFDARLEARIEQAKLN